MSYRHGDGCRSKLLVTRCRHKSKGPQNIRQGGWGSLDWHTIGQAQVSLLVTVGDHRGTQRFIYHTSFIWGPDTNASTQKFRHHYLQGPQGARHSSFSNGYSRGNFRLDPSLLCLLFKSWCNLLVSVVILLSLTVELL